MRVLNKVFLKRYFLNVNYFFLKWGNILNSLVVIDFFFKVKN